MKKKQIIGSYQIGHTIGRGAFGKVKLGKHILTQQNVAIKIFEKERLDKSQLKRIQKQIQILKELKHKNIIQIYEIVQTPLNLYLIMEYVENGQLFQYIKSNKKLSQKIAAKIFYQLISAISYMHKNKIVHRDIKPQNILLTNTLDIKIVDFGLSTSFQQKNKLQSSCGSPCYALPEMLLGEKYFAKQADVWSAGVVLFTMICGYLPFQDSDIKKLYKKIMMNELEFLPQNSSEVRDLLQNILNKNKQKRYDIQSIKYHKWFLKYFKPDYNSIQQKQLIDERLFNQMEIYGVEPNYARHCLETEKYNFATTLYKLLKRKLDKTGSQALITNSSTALTIKQKIIQQFDSFQSDQGGFQLDKNDFQSNLSEIRDKYGFATKQISSINPSVDIESCNSKSKIKKQMSNIKRKQGILLKKENHGSPKKQLSTNRKLSKKQQESTDSRKNAKKKKKTQRNEEYFNQKRSKQKISEKKLSMYEKIEPGCNGPGQYQVLYLNQKQKKLSKHIKQKI